jgi:hypothetical protein
VRTHQNLPPDAPEPAQSRSEPNLAHPFNPTPEPWKIAHSNYANAPFVIYSGEIDPKWDRRYPLTDVDWIAEVKHDESEQHQEQIANARLLWFAPRMLRLIRQISGLAWNTPQEVMSAIELTRELLRDLEGGAR